MKSIPVNIISGFLGSGKTTAILRLLEQKPSDERWAIVVNEFGKISIDGQTLQSKSVQGTVFDIFGGCICCSAKLYLKENLEKIISTKSFDRIIIEPSGLGGIEMVSEIVAANHNLELMPVICMVDITAIENQKLRRSMIYQSQIRMSALIFFSKCDLLESEAKQTELVNLFHTLFPEKNYCFISILLNVSMLNQSEFNTNSINQIKDFLIPAEHLSDNDYVEHLINIDKKQILNTLNLTEIIQKYPGIVRAKGYIQTENGWMLFNYTLSSFSFEPTQNTEINKLVIIAEKLNFDFQKFRESFLSQIITRD